MIGRRLNRQKKALCTKPWKYQHRGCLGTEERVSVDKVKVKQRGRAEAGAHAGCENAGESHYSPVHQSHP